MNIKDQVVSLELAKEMKELGVKQDSFWHWTWAEWNEEVEWVLILPDEAARLKKEKFSAYTVAELGERLPLYFYSFDTELDGWQCATPDGFFKQDSTPYTSVDTLFGPLRIPAEMRRYMEEAKTEADARAKIVIYLIKEGYIKEGEIK